MGEEVCGTQVLDKMNREVSYVCANAFRVAASVSGILTICASLQWSINDDYGITLWRTKRKYITYGVNWWKWNF